MGRSRRSHGGGRSRSENKALTHAALQRAALKLLAHQSFDATSLREVTREAGISPTAFYRHFDDMDELGLELVEAAFGRLHQMLREGRADPDLPADAVRRSVEIVAQHVRDNSDYIRFIARERYGGVRRLRRAIARELQLFADELAVDLAAFPVVGTWGVDDRRMLAGLIAETMMHTAAELVDTPPDERDALLRAAEQQLLLVNLGVLSWNSGR